MKIARVATPNRIAYGIIEAESIHLLSGDPFSGILRSGEVLPLAQVRLLAPCLPSKAVCVGLNYRAHAEEVAKALPTEPLFFLKPPSALLDPLGVIDYPPETRELHYEAELAVVIGKTAHRISVEEVPAHVLGYTCANDVSARDIQNSDGQWTRGKSFDTFLPLGPWIETELDPDAADIRLTLNGETKQDSNTRDLIADVCKLVSLASRVMTLQPGDVLLTGTPSGIGPMQIGDTVVVEIAGIGKLENTVGLVP